MTHLSLNNNNNNKEYVDKVGITSAIKIFENSNDNELVCVCWV